MWDVRGQPLGKLSQVSPPGLFKCLPNLIHHLIIFTFMITTTHGSVDNTLLCVMHPFKQIFILCDLDSNMWKCILPKKYRIQINNILSDYMMPSISGKGKSSPWHLVESIIALPRMRARDWSLHFHWSPCTLPKLQLVASPASQHQSGGHLGSPWRKARTQGPPGDKLLQYPLVFSGRLL